MKLCYMWHLFKNRWHKTKKKTISFAQNEDFD